MSENKIELLEEELEYLKRSLSDDAIEAKKTELGQLKFDTWLKAMQERLDRVQARYEDMLLEGQ